MAVIGYIAGLIRDMLLTLLYLVQLLLAYWFIVLPLILLIVLVIFVLRLLWAILRRFRFVVKIKRIVNKKCGTVRVLRVPFSSLFVNNGKIDMLVDVGKEKYALKYFPGNPLNKNVYIHDLETAYTLRRNVQTIKGKWGGRVNFIYNRCDSKMKKYALKELPADRKTTVLVISPAPYEIYVYDKNKYRITGNGENFEKLLIYTDNGFLDFLQRQ